MIPDLYRILRDPAARTIERRAIRLTSFALERFSDALHAPRLSPPLPPHRKRGKVGGVWSLFTPMRRQ